MKYFYILIPVLPYILSSCSSDELLDSVITDTRTNIDILAINRPIVGEKIVNSIFTNVSIDSVNYSNLCWEVQSLYEKYNKWYGPLFEKLCHTPIFRIYNVTDPTLVSIGGYDPINNAIMVLNNNVLGKEVINEELIHAGQDRVYPNGTAQYVKKTGASNIEFEAKLTMDLINYINGEPFHSGEGLIYGEEYPIWIDSLCKIKGTIFDYKFPSASKVLTTTVNQGQLGYFQMMKSFILKEPQYNYPIDQKLKPLYINYIYNSINK